MRFYKGIFLIIFLIMILLTTSSFVFANEVDENAKIDVIRTQVLKDFEDKKNTLETVKEQFGLSDSETFSNATLGDGFSFYNISLKYLSENSNNDSLLSFGGYIFPIEINNKAAGIVVIREIDGILKMAEITNNLTFKQDVTDVKNLNKQQNSSKLIYDKYFNIYGLAIQNGSDNIIPINDNSAYGIEKHQTKSFDLISEKLKKDYLERNNTKLGGNITDKNNVFSNSRIIFYVLTFLCIAIVCLAFIFNKLNMIQR